MERVSDDGREGTATARQCGGDGGNGDGGGGGGDGGGARLAAPLPI